MESILLPISTLCWLGVTALYDLHKRSAPNWLTLPVLTASLIWGVIQGEWTVSVFVLMLILVSDLTVIWGITGAAVLVVIYQLLPIPAFTMGLCMKTLGLFGIWSIWKQGKMGGADAKVLLALTQTFGLIILLVVLVTGGLLALYARLKHQSTMPYLVAVFFGSLVYFLKILFTYP